MISFIENLIIFYGSCEKCEDAWLIWYENVVQRTENNCGIRLPSHDRSRHHEQQVEYNHKDNHLNLWSHNSKVQHRVIHPKIPRNHSKIAVLRRWGTFHGICTILEKWREQRWNREIQCKQHLDDLHIIHNNFDVNSCFTLCYFLSPRREHLLQDLLLNQIHSGFHEKPCCC